MLSLTGCGTGPISTTEYIRPTIPALPAKPDYYPVAWQKVDELYCLTPGSAKNLLKNKALQDGREKDLEEIIEGLR